jgi:hypothetical protein
MKRTAIVSILALVLFVSVNSLHAATLRKLGNHPLYKTENLKAQDIFRIVKDQKMIVKDGFIKAGAIDLYQPFMSQLETAAFDEIQVQPNETMLWMIFKKKNKAHVLQRVEWKGNRAFPAYRFVVQHMDRDYEFIIPNECTNIALKGVKETPAKDEKEKSPPVEPITKKNEAPYCTLKVAPQKLYTGEVLVLDASGSRDTDGEIKSVKLTLTNRSTERVEEVVLDKAPFIHETTLKKAGDYEIQANVTDDDGDSTSCVAQVMAKKRGFFVIAPGFLKQWDPAVWVPIQVGYMYKLKEDLALTGLAGPAPLISGCSDRPAFLLDALVHKYFNNFFVGGGMGMFHTSYKTRADLIIDLGYQLSNQINGPNVSIYLQGRSAVDELDNISELGRGGGGLRVHF